MTEELVKPETYKLATEKGFELYDNVSQNLLQRALREIYKLNIFVVNYQSTKIFRFYIQDAYIDEVNYGSYEACLEQGLTKALSIIKMPEKQENEKIKKL